MAPKHAPQKRIHATGFVVLDLLVADDTVIPHVGGTAANVAINLSLLGWEAAVSGLLGDDSAGRTIRRQLEAYGVDTTALINDPDVETPIVIHEVTKSRHKFRFSCPHCGAKYAKFRPLPPTKASVAPEADVHFFDRASSYAIEVSRSRRGGSAIVFEPGTPGRPAATTSMVELAHLFRASGDLGLTEQAVAASSKRVQVIGLGADGVKYRLRGENEWRHLPSRVAGRPVDAGGAGDWLTASLLNALDPSSLRSNTIGLSQLQDAVDRALDFAEACCRHLGTRGFVGTDDWIGLLSSAPNDGVLERRPQSEGTLIAKDGGCAVWYHQPKR